MRSEEDWRLGGLVKSSLLQVNMVSIFVIVCDYLFVASKMYA